MRYKKHPLEVCSHNDLDIESSGVDPLLPLEASTLPPTLLTACSSKTPPQRPPETRAPDGRFDTQPEGGESGYPESSNTKPRRDSAKPSWREGERGRFPES